MKIVLYVVLILLVLLAAASGIAKIMLVPEEAAFFGRFGFSDTALIVLGAVQLLGAALLAWPGTRVIGAAIVGVSFLLSAALLFVAGNILLGVVSVVVAALLGLVAKRT